MTQLIQTPAVLWSIVAACVVLICLGVWVVLQLQRKLSLLRDTHNALIDLVDRDDLTSARSRRYMRTVFGQEVQDGQNALAFIDLDNFKSVNDGYGHKAGDALLRTLADALVEAQAENEIVFRIGGDEFGIYMRDTDLDTATARGEVMRELIAGTSIFVDGVRVRRTGSVGVARIERGQDFVGALYYADEAQYAAKRAGGDKVRQNAGETLRSMIARRTGPRAEDIERAISSDEVKYHVQPIFDTRAGRPIGVEALIRWQRSDGRVMMPHQFLDVMTGGATNAELRPSRAMAQQVAMAFTGTPQDIFCSFNISSGFLETAVEDDPRLLDGLLAGLNPNRTVLEIVEHAEIRNPEKAQSLLSLLRSEGVRVALDDFGTGLSNLERLQQLDVDIVKIDRRFVRGINTQGADIGILRALRDLSKDMSFEIIAEGVETEAELDMLNSIGIWNAQGFFLGRPDTAENWLDALGLRRVAPPRAAMP